MGPPAAAWRLGPIRWNSAKPLWLSAGLSISLELEPSYQENCRVLRIT
jgi:hypothetical protein